MTVSDQIQKLRKEHHFSQETLAEMLGVSRQAISKWESGAAMPEVDKLIELSRIFQVSLNQLLLGEEPVGEDQPDAIPASADFSEQQLEAVKEIMTAYSGEQKRRERRSWLFGAAALLMAASALLSGLLFLNLRLDRLQEQLSESDGRISSIEANVQQQIGSISGEIQNSLKQQASLVSDSSFEVVQADRELETVVLRMTAIPKLLTDETKAEFTATGDSSDPVTVPAVRNGSSFSAEITVPLENNIKGSVTFRTGENSQTELIGQEYSLRDDYLTTIIADFKGDILYLEQSIKLQGEFAVQTRSGYLWMEQNPDYGLGKISVEFLVDGKTADALRWGEENETPPEVYGPAPPEPVPGGESTFYMPYQEEITLKANETLEIRAVVKDTDGRTYHAPIKRFQADASGNISEIPL